MPAPGVLKRSTLERHLYRAGYGREQMQMYRDARGSSFQRFCKPHRMMLVQGDIKYGPKLPIGKNGARVQSIFPLQSMTIPAYCWLPVSYDSQEEAIVEDTFRQAILRYGKFDACYFDNGFPVYRQTDQALSFKTGDPGSPCKTAERQKAKGRLKSSIR